MAEDDIADIIEHTPHKRNSVFTPLVTLKAFIFQVLGDDSSCKQAVASVLADRACGKSHFNWFSSNRHEHKIRETSV
ncbi:MAG: hypothetical protein PHO08_15890 [Methylococcales bacterium]|nr:hypothetical protein [Methylococcales bacterium]